MNNKSQSHQFHSLLHSSALIDDYLRIKLSPLGLGHHQARVIIALDRMGEVSQVKLAREFAITAASMSTMTTRLETAAYISRKKDPSNTKRNLISLTEKGKALVIDINNVWDEVDSHLESKIGVDKLQQVSEITLTLREALGGRRPGEK